MTVYVRPLSLQAPQAYPLSISKKMSCGGVYCPVLEKKDRKSNKTSSFMEERMEC